MLSAAGFEIHDLGRDVAPRRFVDTALKLHADIIAISTLMTTTMDGMADVIRILNRENVRGHFKVLVGGAPFRMRTPERFVPTAMPATRSRLRSWLISSSRFMPPLRSRK